jgi:hypothetical protein
MDIKSNKIKVNNFSIDLMKFDESIYKQYPDYDPSICMAKIEFELHGINRSIGNAIRRAALDELESYCLETPSPYNCIIQHKDTDTKIIDDYISINIRSIPLLYRPDRIDPKIEEYTWEINVKNNTPMDQEIFSNDLKCKEKNIKIFNQNILLCNLQPYKCLHIDNIKLSKGIGRDNAAFQVVKKSIMLDIDTEEYPYEETHLIGGSQVDNSGFKESNLMSDPTKFKFKGVINSVDIHNKNIPDYIKSIYIDACNTVVQRLKNIETALINSDNINIDLKVKKTVDVYDAILKIFNENQTIGILLHRMIHDTFPFASEESNVSAIYNYKQHEYLMELHIKTTHNFDIKTVLIDSIKTAYKIYDQIIKEFQNAKVKMN